MRNLSNSRQVAQHAMIFMLLIKYQQNLAMIRNSTKKFKEKYAYSSVKMLRLSHDEREESEASQHSVRFNSTQSFNLTRSTPKLENSKKIFNQTHPIITNNHSKAKEDKYSVLTDQTSIETIHTIMRKKGIDENQIEQVRSSKLRKVNRSSFKVRDPQEFIQNLPKNSLFFCCECYQYIFEIQKNRHYPDCKDQLNRSEKDMGQVGLKKLEKIVQLAKYTQTNVSEITELYNEFINGSYHRLTVLTYPKFNFFTLKEITYSFLYVFDKLLKDKKYAGDSTFFSCF